MSAREKDAARCACAVELDKLRMAHEENPDSVSFVLIGSVLGAEKETEYFFVAHNMTQEDWAQSIYELQMRAVEKRLGKQ